MNDIRLPPRRALNWLMREHLVYFAQRCFQYLNPGERFIWGIYLYAIAYALERVAKGETKRLIISLPPRHLKSIMASVAFPAWLLGHDPTKKIVSASYGADLSELYSVQTRDVILSSWYRRLFPLTLLDRRRLSVDEFHTTKRGLRIATTVGGALTGRGGNIVIIDDPMKAKDAASQAIRDAVWDWFTGTVVTRLNNPSDDAIVVIAQRLHEDDLIGRLLEAGGWEHLSLPAVATDGQSIPIWGDLSWEREAGQLLHPDRIDEKALKQIKKELGTYHYSAQIQQQPIPIEGNLVRIDWFRRYQERRPLEGYEAIVQSWDTAQVPGAANDYSVCTTWGVLDGRFHLLHVYRGQIDYPTLRRFTVEYRKQWKAGPVIVERAGSGISLYQDLRVQGLNWIFQLGTEGMDKQSRLAQQSAKMEAGMVVLPKEAPWLAEYEKEMAGFPNAKHDDQVDSTSQFLRAYDWNPRLILGLVRTWSN
jgi:predicted phage terminase large subunit-like protein